MQMESAEMVEIARSLLKSHGYFVEKLWHVNDVHFICEQNERPQLTDEEAMEVFSIASQQFDGETGISWPQLEKAVDVYINRKALLNRLCDGQQVS